MSTKHEEYVRECQSKIVGTPEWGLVKQHVAIMEGRGRSLVYDDSTSKPVKKEKNPGASSELIDVILHFIEKGGWAQIEGGECDKCWVNSKYYPDKVFRTGRVKEENTGEIHYFPLSSLDEDPEGVALHYELYGAGGSYNIRPNIWRMHSTFKQRKRESRERRKKAREINHLAYEEVDRMPEHEYDENDGWSQCGVDPDDCGGYNN